jgi:hypothetical protein
MTPSSPLTLNVAFTFAERWEFGPADKLNGFPPGGGDGILSIEIGPVNFAGLSAAEITAVQRKRAGDLALLSQAIAAASVQFSQALDAAG